MEHFESELYRKLHPQERVLHHTYSSLDHELVSDLSYGDNAVYDDWSIIYSTTASM